MPVNTAKVEGRTFTVTFPNVRDDLSFDLKLVDTDNAKGTRKFHLRPTRDAEPQRPFVQRWPSGHAPFAPQATVQSENVGR